MFTIGDALLRFGVSGPTAGLPMRAFGDGELGRNGCGGDAGRPCCKNAATGSRISVRGLGGGG
jgi:hypothetical protein